MNKIKSILTGLAVVLLMAACGDDTGTTDTEAPRDELIVGTWQSVVHRQDGNVVTGEGYREFEFRDNGTVLIEEFEEDGSPIDNIEDNWALTESDERIQFDTEGQYDVIKMNADSMTLEYNKADPFSGDLILHSDDFLKQ